MSDEPLLPDFRGKNTVQYIIWGTGLLAMVILTIVGGGKAIQYWNIPPVESYMWGLAVGVWILVPVMDGIRRFVERL